MKKMMDTWNLHQILTASDGMAGGLFGVEVSIDGNQLIVGASGDDELLGAAYLYGGFFRNSAAVPTLNQWAMIAMTGFLRLLGMYAFRKFQV